MFDHQLYHTVLILAGIANLAMAAALLHGNIAYADYTVYRRARRFVALCLAVFAAGFFLHAHYEWRFTRPDISTALSVSYFHIGAVLFGWSHTSLLDPGYLTRKVFARDLIILLAGLTAYWCPFLMDTPPATLLQYIIFFLHSGYISYVFYCTYFRVRHRLRALAMAMTGRHVRWMLLSCHLIIGFGIGSIALTVCLPNSIWPYTLLLCVGILVFVYIFYSLNIYGEVIDSVTNATEDVTMKNRKL